MNTTDSLTHLRNELIKERDNLEEKIDELALEIEQLGENETF